MEIINLTVDQIELILKDIVDFNNSLSEDDDLRWMGEQMANLYKLCLETDQQTYPDVDFYPCRKVAKLQRFVEQSSFMRLHIPHVMMAGVFAAIDGVVLSPELGAAVMSDRKDKISKFIDPDEFHSEYFDGTIQRLDNGKYFVLKKNEICPSVLNSSTSYRVLSL